VGSAPQPWRAMLADQRRYQPGPSPGERLAADGVASRLGGESSGPMPHEQHGDGPQRLHCGDPGGDGTLACDGHCEPRASCGRRAPCHLQYGTDCGATPLKLYALCSSRGRQKSAHQSLLARAPEIGTRVPGTLPITRDPGPPSQRPRNRTQEPITLRPPPAPPPVHPAWRRIRSGCS